MTRINEKIRKDNVLPDQFYSENYSFFSFSVFAFFSALSPFTAEAASVRSPRFVVRRR